jgi:uncharacterized membrane protein
LLRTEWLPAARDVLGRDVNGAADCIMARSAIGMWHPFDDGGTIGTLGSESGTILRDDEHEGGARITLERDGCSAPFAITCGVYGSMVHTRQYGSRRHVQRGWADTKRQLDAIMRAMPALGDPDEAAKQETVSALIAALTDDKVFERPPSWRRITRWRINAPPGPRMRAVMRWIMAAFYVIAGIGHLLRPEAFLPIVPDWVPLPREVLLATGVCELAGAAALLTTRLRWYAGVMLALYALCVFPANIKHAVEHIIVPPIPDSWWYHAPRLALQPVLIWWALFCAEVIEWPWRRAVVARSGRDQQDERRNAQ